MPRASLLVIDDEPNILTTVKRALELEGFAVEVAGSAAAGLTKLAEHDIDLVLLDVMMPRMDGFEVCQAVRAEPAIAATRILMLTAKGRANDAAKGTALGADAYVTKPFSTRELATQVAAMLASP